MANLIDPNEAMFKQNEGGIFVEVLTSELVTFIMNKVVPWIETSLKDHPDNVKVPDVSSVLGSHNREFNNSLDIFDTYILNKFK